jgi:hypothetical protein
MGSRPSGYSGPSDFYGPSGPTTPPGGAWPPPPLWKPAVADPFPVPAGGSHAPAPRRSWRHLVGYPLTAVAGVAVAVAFFSSDGPAVAAPAEVPAVTVTVTATPAPAVTPERRRRLTPNPTTAPAQVDAAAFYESCAAARAAGSIPLLVGDPGYRSSLDKDKDGRACE